MWRGCSAISKCRVAISRNVWLLAIHGGHDCDSGVAMVARVDTTTSMVEGLSDTLKTSCELIRVFNTLRQGVGSGGHKHFWLTTCMA